MRRAWRPAVRQESVHPRLAQAFLDAALQRRVLEARAGACQVAVWILELALFDGILGIGVAAELGIGRRKRQLEQRIARVADALRLEQAHGVSVATGQQIGQAEIERGLRADADVEAYGRLGGGQWIRRGGRSTAARPRAPA